MDRRDFIKYSGAGLASLVLGGVLSPLAAKPRGRRYNIVILGDTHFDASPPDVYHSDFIRDNPGWRDTFRQREFKRNGDMWRDRVPRLARRAARLIDGDTRMVLQMGDLVQGDGGSAEAHKRMLSAAMDFFKGQFGDTPFVSVAGNHDVRGKGALETYREYMPQRMSEELGMKITGTNFAFGIGPDAFVVVDFNSPSEEDDTAVERMLADTAGARNTFVVVHGPLFPFDGGNPRFFYHGGKGKAAGADDAKRRRFRRLFAERGVIALCGHTHRTEFLDWQGDGGRITQMTMNSVWASEAKQGKYETDASGAEQYGILHKAGSDPGGAKPLFDEYRPGLAAYSHSPAAGAYKLTVRPGQVAVDFYAGDSEALSHRFVLRG